MGMTSGDHTVLGTRRLSIHLVATAVALAFAGATTAVVYAHAEPERSIPAADSVVPRAPDRVDVCFTQELFRREGANVLTVEGPDGVPVDSGDSTIDASDRERMSVGLPRGLPDGEYTVHWVTLSAIDGDAAEGSFTFTIDPTAPEPTAPASDEDTAGQPTAVATSTDQAAPASSLINEGAAFPWWAVTAAVALLASAGLGAWALATGEPGELEP